jgi:glycosyltransferase involved in cell wall biosynthesis
MSNRTLVFVPAYNCERQVLRVLAQLEEGWVRSFVSQVIVVDNGSTDATRHVVAEHARQCSDDYISLVINDANYGLGGSHKVAFQYAREQGFDWLVVLHGDDQGTIADFRGVIERPEALDVDAVLGSRFMRGSRSPGYSRFRILGNLVFNAIYSLCLRRRIHDLGAGLNMYRVARLRIDEVLRYPDNLTFNCVMLCSQVIRGDRIRFAPVSWREDDQVSNVKLVRQSFQTLGIALRAFVGREWFPAAEHRHQVIAGYSWKVVAND